MRNVMEKRKSVWTIIVLIPVKTALWRRCDVVNGGNTCLCCSVISGGESGQPQKWRGKNLHSKKCHFLVPILHSQLKKDAKGLYNCQLES